MHSLPCRKGVCMGRYKKQAEGEAAKRKLVPVKYDECGRKVLHNKTVCRYFLSDVLGIPPEEIRKIKYLDTSLLKKFRNQKYGILDVLVELNDHAKIDIEIQLKIIKHWDKRQLFYLSRLYGDGLASGEEYRKLKRCIGISILDFNLDNREDYHRVYYIQDKEGNHFTEDFELHIIELRKELKGDRMDDWIRLFNAESEEELDMIKTANTGIREAIREVKRFSLIGAARDVYRDYMDAKRDRKAIEDYIKEEAEKQGLAEGREQGCEQKLIEIICKKIKKGKSPEQIAEELEEDLFIVEEICHAAKVAAPDYDISQISAILNNGKKRKTPSGLVK